MFKKTLMLGAVLIGLAGVANAGTTMNVFDSIAAGIAHKTYVSGPACELQSDEENLEDFIAALSKGVGFYIEERSLYNNNLHYMTEIDDLAMLSYFNNTYTCNPDDDEVMNKLNKENARLAYLYAKKILDERK